MDMNKLITLAYYRENDHERYLRMLDEFDIRELPQKDRIMKYLKDFGSITPLEALRDLGIMRLGARIWELIREGWEIIRDMESGENRYGQTTRYARYRRVA